MDDLTVGIAILWGLAALLFWLGVRVGRRVSRRAACLLTLPALGLIALYTFVFIDDPRLAWVLPVSSLVVVGNWTPLAVGWLAGLVWTHGSPPAWRKAAIVVLMGTATAAHAHVWVLGVPPKCGDVWLDGVCMQTSRSSCSAACAATVLRAHGIAATEKEMARLCLTRSTGTTALGVYRGLKLKTAGTPYDVETFSWTVDELRESPPGPVILHVRLDKGATTDPRYTRDWGWTVGRGHAVVFYRFLDNGLIEMGDPSIGREKWHEDSLDVLWHGTGLRLVER